ncbi:MAG TPA: type II toxin-antitoxin system VapC family toxin [Thermoanaerobaculia bacterium]
MTRVIEALAGVRKLAIDTSPLIYLAESHPAYGPSMRALIGHVEANGVELVTSTITLTEVLTLPLRHGAELIVQAYRDILLDSRYLRLVSTDVAAAEEAARLRARYRLKTPDAIQLAVALQAGCDAFLTNDQDLGRVQDLRVLLLSDLQAV